MNLSVDDGHQQGKPCPHGHHRSTIICSATSSPLLGEPLRVPDASPGPAPAPVQLRGGGGGGERGWSRG